ncbi:MAG: Nif3-like dinuclear metal center hexameric protein [Lachnospiraceae bacterium]|jgi:putative NIF3 family GTP cyclohydrolase 1 type 2
MTIREVIAALEAFHHPVDPEHTCDVFKYGDPDCECTGIALTCFASVEVIREAARQGKNLIICHEPIFFSHEDKTEWLKGNKVFEAKRQLLDKTGIVVWRNHDHMHSGHRGEYDVPDYIFLGIMKVLGWDDYLVESEKKPLLFDIPETTARNLTAEICEKFNLNGARIIGDPDAPVRKVFFAEHITGKEFDSSKLQRIDEEEFDAIIPLETVDWTILEYVADSVSLGRPRAVISLGHFNFEEPGMQYMAKWLPDVIGTDIPVSFIQSGDIYSYLIS